MGGCLGIVRNRTEDTENANDGPRFNAGIEISFFYQVHFFTLKLLFAR